MVKGSDRLTNNDYRSMRSKAEKLRKKGLSYKEIQNEIPVSKSTLSIWLRNIHLTEEQRSRLGKRYDTQLRGAKANQMKAAKRREEIRVNAKRQISKPTRRELKLAGALLYWAEGAKTSSTSVTNSDPTFIIFWIRWLGEVLEIAPDQLRGHIHLHDGQDEDVEKLYWSKLTGIPLENFGKSYFKPVGTGHRRNKLYHGTLRVRIAGKGSELLRQKILGWVEGFIENYVPEEIIKEQYSERTGR